MTPEQIAGLGNFLSTAASAVGLPAVVAAIIFYLLNRKGANKKLSLDERTVGASEFEANIGAYKDLLSRGNDNLEKALEQLKEALAERAALVERVENLEKADTAKSGELDNANRKIDSLRRLITSYIDRTGVPLTTEELAVFEQTVPSPRLLREDT